MFSTLILPWSSIAPSEKPASASHSFPFLSFHFADDPALIRIALRTVGAGGFSPSTSGLVTIRRRHDGSGFDVRRRHRDDVWRAALL